MKYRPKHVVIKRENVSAVQRAALWRPIEWRFWEDRNYRRNKKYPNSKFHVCMLIFNKSFSHDSYFPCFSVGTLNHVQFFFLSSSEKKIQENIKIISTFPNCFPPWKYVQKLIVCTGSFVWFSYQRESKRKRLWLNVQRFSNIRLHAAFVDSNSFFFSYHRLCSW